MTREEWLEVQVGDVLIDHMSGDSPREVLSVRRVTGRRGQPRGATRTVVTLANLRSPLARPVSVASSDDLRGTRFSLERRNS